MGFTDISWTYSLIQIVFFHRWSYVYYLPRSIVPARVNKPSLKIYVDNPIRQLGWITTYLSSKFLNSQFSRGKLAQFIQDLLEGWY